MDISSLEVPRAGRSRFSKALPTPPEFGGQTQTPLRELPDAPPAPPPPRKSGTLTTSKSATSLRAKAFDSPLPPLPIMAEPPRPRVIAGPITRKPVGLPTPPASVGPKTKSKAMKRQSSISSLLSAYSRSSSDWAQRSSHESDFTKESEPSYSPEREDVNSLPPVPSKNSLEVTNDTTSDGASEITSYTIIDHFPPPPPLKNPSRPRTPPSTRRPSVGSKDGEGGTTSPTPSTLRSGSPRTGREIWRRRASSKSDASLVIAELKLPSSNGSTASTSHPPPKNAELPSLPPPLPAKPDSLPALPLPPKEHHQQQPVITTTTTPLPPRTTSLPGKNIRPIKQTEPLDKDDEMGKFKKLAKLKGLIRRDNNGDGDGGGGGGGDEEQKQSQKSVQKGSLEKSEQCEHREIQNAPDIKGKAEADKPEPPAKDVLVLQQHTAADAPANAPKTTALEASALPASPSDTPAPLLNEPGKTTGTAISRRPVGALPSRNPNQSDPLQLEPGKRQINKPKAPSSSIRSMSSLMPIYEGPHLPHPQQGIPPRLKPQPAPLVYSHPVPQDLQGPRRPRGPTSPTGATPRSGSTFAHSKQFAAPTAPMAGSHQASGAFSPGSPNAQSPFSKPASPRTQGSPEKGSLSLQELIDSSPISSLPAPNASFLTQAPASNKEREAAAPVQGPSAGATEYKEATEQPMTAAAAAAIALFPRRQRWNVQCTVDGVWPPNPLGDRHHNCITKHTKLLNSPNTNYPLACHTCGIADKERRFMCTFCNLRICQSCADILVANGRDLRVLMGILKDKGLMHEWDEYPKRADSGI
ncbi:hypothetical protein F5Y07DRAFT_294696 [Xylaria sp. FL0933]|nr:hypothetical protein F5Y07DRAFT_294696 [Xylaria sp. FL0933]